MKIRKYGVHTMDSIPLESIGLYETRLSQALLSVKKSLRFSEYQIDVNRSFGFLTGS